MAESAYENACNRAELFGLEKPDHDTFISDYETKRAEIDPEDLLDAEINAEILNGAFGKFDELSHILTNTQVKIKRFRKRACSSFASYLKIRQEVDDEAAAAAAAATGSSSLVIKSTEDDSNENDESIIESNENSTNDKDIENGNDTVETMTASLNAMSVDHNQELKSKSQQMNKNMTSQLDKLDALLMKAENAQFSMASQNKQMKNILK